ncbi:MAG: nucleoside-diphosphate kinase [Bacilli bacterium]|nr:nucleoside-diphosphate kinase [Bacilli bacterium]MDD4282621.1 nucleoside-diphosphate kinase [Bacilli bacterium]MDD4718652.1 nucleoside-diphosphate kinase [Bacilli bacterium]
MEKTYIMLKPDAVKRKVVGNIINRIENKGYNITTIKMFNLDEEILKEHYSHLVDMPFFPELVSFMTSGPVIGMIVEGDDVVQGMRNLMGPTKWVEAMPGTIRGDFANNTTQNLIHGSDSVANAIIEIERFFG